MDACSNTWCHIFRKIYAFTLLLRTFDSATCGNKGCDEILRENQALLAVHAARACSNLEIHFLRINYYQFIN